MDIIVSSWTIQKDFPEVLNKQAPTGVRTRDLSLQSQKTYALGYRHPMPGRVGWLIQIFAGRAASTRLFAAQAATARLSAPPQGKVEGGDEKKSFDLPLGNETTDNSKHISNICSVSILKKYPHSRGVESVSDSESEMSSRPPNSCQLYPVSLD